MKGMDEEHKKEMRRVGLHQDQPHSRKKFAVDIQDYCIEDCWMGVRLFNASRSTALTSLGVFIRGVFH